MKIADFFKGKKFIIFREYCEKTGLIDMNELKDIIDHIPDKTGIDLKKIQQKYKQYDPAGKTSKEKIDKRKIVWEYKLANYEINGKYLNRLPLFSSKPVDMKSNELHPSYKEDEPVEYLLLSMRASRVLAVLGIKTIGELLMNSAEQLLEMRNCGKKTVIDIRVLVKRFLLVKSKGLSLSWRSFNSMVKSLASINDRDFVIFKKKLGIGTGSHQTLKVAGKQYGLTRERVRQIMDSTFDSIRSNPPDLLQTLWDRIDIQLEKYYGPANYDIIADKVSDLFNWKKKVKGHVLAEFAVNCNKKYFVDHYCRLLCHSDHPCLNCKGLTETFHNLIAEKGKISTTEVQPEILHYCQNKCSEKDKIFDVRMIQFLARKIEDIRIFDDYIYSNQEYKNKLKQKRLLRLREQDPAYDLTDKILFEAGTSLKNTEIEAKLIEYSKKINRGLTQIIKDCENVYRWGWGSYIHRKYIDVPTDLMDSIYNYIQVELDSGIPFLSMQKVFEKYEKQCLDHDIPNDIALYSVLDICDYQDLTLPRFPAIFISDKFAKDTIYTVLEKYLLEKKEAIDFSALYDFFVNKVGLKEPVFQWFVIKDKNIVRLPENKIAHVKYAQ